MTDDLQVNREDWVALAQQSVQEEAAEGCAPPADTVAQTSLGAVTHLLPLPISHPSDLPFEPGPEVSSEASSASEAARLAALHEYRLVDAPADDELSAVVRAAALVAGVPHATLNLIDENRQCQLTTVGFEGTDSARADSMCALHFEDGEVVHVPDASLDARYIHNPWVDGRLAQVRFYASAPLLSPGGYALGSLCVFDTVPGHLSGQQVDALRDLAGVLVALFERRRQARQAVEVSEQAAEARELAVLAMAEAEARWELSEVVAETIDTGLVVVDADGHVSSLNRTARHWHGLEGAVRAAERTAPGLGLPAALDVETSRAAVSDYFAADGVTALENDDLPWLRALREGSIQDVEIVLAVEGQPRRALVCSGQALRRGDGELLGAVVALNDVTLARQRERALLHAHAAMEEAHTALSEHTRRVQALADASRALTIAEDPQEAVCRSVRELTGADAAYLLRPVGGGQLRAVATAGLPPVQVTVDPDESSLAAVAFTSSVPLFVADIAAHPEGSQRLVQLMGVTSGAWQPVLLPGDRTVGVLGVFWRTRQARMPEHVMPVLQTLSAEVAHALERTELLQRLAQAAERDPLTGLANRRRWDQAVSAEVARAARSGAPLSVALIDLDHFKAYNDAHGHLGGDGLLREFATAAAACLREVDVLARWGGEEFVVALPGCSATDAVAVADRIRAAVPRRQTCTIGIAQWRDGLLAEDVIAQADEALYRGKQRGRDATVVHSAGAPASP